MPRSSLFCQPRAQLRDLQSRRLRHFIRHQIYPYHPFYKKLFDKHGIKPRHIRSAGDLSKIPLSGKEDFFAAEKSHIRSLDFTLQPNRNYTPFADKMRWGWQGLFNGKAAQKKTIEREYKPIFVTATTGTTNEPVSFLYTHYDIENLHLNGHRIIEVTQVKHDDRGVNMFPYAPHLAFWQTFFAGISGDVFILSTGGGKTIGTYGNINAMKKIQPSWLIGTPSYVYHVLKVARETGEKIPSIRKIVLGASRVPPGFKKKLAMLLEDMGAKDVHIIGTYGFTEAKTAWCECPTDLDVSSGYHTYPDMEIFEIVDPETGQTLPEGSDGEVVYTSLNARGTCVLRYRTRDFVRGGIMTDPCPHCGMTVPRISNDISRATSIQSLALSKIKGVLVNFDNLELCLQNVEDIDEYLIEICKKDNDPFEVEELYLYCNLVRPDANAENIKHAINESAMAHMEITFNKITVLTKEEMYKRLDMENSIKIKRVHDLRPKE